MTARARGGRTYHWPCINQLLIATCGQMGGMTRERRRRHALSRVTAAAWVAHGLFTDAIVPRGFMTEPNQH